MSIQPANSTVQKPSNLSYLIPYIKNGRTLRNEYSIMYNTPHKNKDAMEPVVKNEISLRNLSSVRQHLFSRDSFTVHTNIDISEQSIDLTGNAIYLKFPFKQGLQKYYIDKLFQLFWKRSLYYLHRVIRRFHLANPQKYKTHLLKVQGPIFYLVLLNQKLEIV